MNHLSGALEFLRLYKCPTTIMLIGSGHFYEHLNLLNKQFHIRILMGLDIPAESSNHRHTCAVTHYKSTVRFDERSASGIEVFLSVVR